MYVQLDGFSVDYLLRYVARTTGRTVVEDRIWTIIIVGWPDGKNSWLFLPMQEHAVV